MPGLLNLCAGFVSDRATKVLMLQSGEADIIDEVPPDMIDGLEKNPNVTIRTVPSHRTNFITINTFRKPFDDVRVRKAMAHAINWQEIIDKLYAGLGYRQGALTPKIIEHYNPNLQPYDYDPHRCCYFADVKRPGGASPLCLKDNRRDPLAGRAVRMGHRKSRC